MNNYQLQQWWSNLSAFEKKLLLSNYQNNQNSKTVPAIDDTAIDAVKPYLSIFEFDDIKNLGSFLAQEHLNFNYIGNKVLPHGINLSLLLTPFQNLKSIIINDLSLNEINLRFLDDLSSFYALEVQSQKLTKLSDITHWSTVSILRFKNCPNLYNLKGINTTGAEKIYLENCPQLNQLNDLSETVILEHLSIINCPQITNFEGLNFHHTLEITVKDCPNFNDMFSLVAAKKLKRLILDHCPKLVQIDIFKFLKQLQFLSISNCNNLEYLYDFSKSKKLTHLTINNCPALNDIQGVAKLHLKYLSLQSCNNIELFSSLKTKTPIEQLELINCTNLAISNNSFLRVNNILIKDSLHLSDLKTLNCYKDVYNINLVNLGLESLKGIYQAKSLLSLTIDNCSNLETISPLKKIENLQLLQIKNCKNLATLKGINKCEKLTSLFLNECEKIQIKEELPYLQKEKKAKPLQHLHLINFYYISDNDVEFLEAALPDCNISIA